MAGFARFLGLEVKLLYFWLYGHTIKPDETVSSVCDIYRTFVVVLLTTALYSSAIAFLYTLSHHVSSTSAL
jgi:hypothetical protein